MRIANSGTSQLRIYDPALGTADVPLINESLQEVGEVLGLVDTTDIDAVCILDPSEVKFSRFFGTPVSWPDGLGFSAPMGLSVTRSGFDRGLGIPAAMSNTTELHMQVSGTRGPVGTNTTTLFMVTTEYDPELEWYEHSWALAGTTTDVVTSLTKENVVDFDFPIMIKNYGTNMGVAALVLDTNTSAILGASWVNVIRIN